jgi:hypothetical protein
LRSSGLEKAEKPRTSINANTVWRSKARPSSLHGIKSWRKHAFIASQAVTELVWRHQRPVTISCVSAENPAFSANSPAQGTRFFGPMAYIGEAIWMSIIQIFPN